MMLKINLFLGNCLLAAVVLMVTYSVGFAHGAQSMRTVQNIPFIGGVLK